MSIAQHFVAGEGSIRPQSATVEQPEHDDPVAVQPANNPVNLCWKTYRAIHRAANHPSIKPAARSLLAALARTVSSECPEALIFANRQLLAQRAMQSVRSLYRSLNELECVGLIDRAEQKRYDVTGKFGRVYLRLSENAISFLGFTELSKPAPAVGNDAIQQAQHRPSPLLGSTACPVAPVPLAIPSATLAHGAIYRVVYPTTQKRQPGAVPADLQRLLALGFHKNLVFGLMRDARQTGKLLSDVVNATWEHIKAAAKPIAYVRALLHSETDFAFLARRRAETVRHQAEAAAEAARVERVVQGVAGQTFFDRNLNLRVTLAADGTSYSTQRYDEPGSRSGAGEWKPAFVQAIEQSMMKPGTPNLQAQFEQRRIDHLQRHSIDSLLTSATSPAEERNTNSAAANLDASYGADHHLTAGVPRKLTPFASESLSALRLTLGKLGKPYAGPLTKNGRAA